MLKILGKIIALTMILTAGSAFADSFVLNLDFPIAIEGPTPSPDFHDSSFMDSVGTCKAIMRIQVKNLEQNGIQVVSKACDYEAGHSMPELGMYAFMIKIEAKGDLSVACKAITMKADNCPK